MAAMSGWSPASVLRWLFDSEHGASGHLLPRWIFLRARGLLVCADAAVVFEQRAHGHGNLLGGDDRLAVAGLESVAARHACDLFRMLSLVRERGAGFFRLSVRWNVAGGGIHFFVFRTGRIPAGLGRRKQAIARELVFAGVGRLPDLFRIGRGEDL